MGYSGNGTSCENINECAVGTDNCHEDAACLDTDGSYECSCNEGYSGNGVACEST
ncbi:fibrillin-2-like isoform X48 [Paramuricea clavata]|uniref:Fibrillin-2-like isoform X48 n=1 Tax=Paramuricea clavata TaxID=317549 RepID=A0A6S7JKA8_PARCT|nr:fibrillin-2-like isoform X48 [Paramuricea clavata]